MYCMGCSLVHLAMLIANLLVKRQDCSVATKLDKEYISRINELTLKPERLVNQWKNNIDFKFMEETCDEVVFVRDFFIVIHVGLFLICSYREVNEANT